MNDLKLGWRLGVTISVVGHISEVAVRRARLMLRWVTVFRRVLYEYAYVFMIDVDRKNMADCFLPDIKSTRTCTEAIDKYLRKFVVNKDYRSACRYIG